MQTPYNLNPADSNDHSSRIPPGLLSLSRRFNLWMDLDTAAADLSRFLYSLNGMVVRRCYKRGLRVDLKNSGFSVIQTLFTIAHDTIG